MALLTAGFLAVSAIRPSGPERPGAAPGMGVTRPVEEEPESAGPRERGKVPALRRQFAEPPRRTAGERGGRGGRNRGIVRRGRGRDRRASPGEDAHAAGPHRSRAPPSRPRYSRGRPRRRPRHSPRRRAGAPNPQPPNPQPPAPPPPTPASPRPAGEFAP